MNQSLQHLPIQFLADMARVLRVLGHEYRLGIVEFLDLNGASPVHRIWTALGGSQAAASHHLSKMRSAGLLSSERRGQEVWYDIDNPAALTVLNCMRERFNPEVLGRGES